MKFDHGPLAQQMKDIPVTAALPPPEEVQIVPRVEQFTDPLPGNGDDFNDDFSALSSEKPAPKEPLSILTFSQIESIPVSDDDQILGDHLLDKGSSLVLAGQGGTGKSRLLFQFIAACRAGHDKFLGFDIHPGARQMRWLVLQTENSVRRLKLERGRIKKWLGDGFALFDEGVFVLAPINEQDTMLNLDDPENATRIRWAIDQCKPDGVISDPLGDFSIGNLDKDVDMKGTIIQLSRLARYGNPKRSLIIAHHAGTGQTGAAKSTGYDRSSFARNSKALFNWTRAQINLASMNENNHTQVAVSCGKCSDGKEFIPFGITLNDDLVYECDPSLDVAEWSQEVKGRNKEKALMDNDEVSRLCQPAMTKTQLAKAITEQIGCGKSSSFRYIARALNKTIKENDGKLFKK